MIETADIRVDYDDVTAVSDVSLSIEAGEVFGLIGPNGAGKTSLIRVLATLQTPTYGEGRVAGLDILERVEEARRVIGYMPDMAPVYKDLRCWEFLDLFARAYFVSREERRRRVDECIDIVQLEQKRNAMAGTLSRGMTQRLVLAKTLLHRPKVLLLDEPASGLDPIARIDLRRLLRRLSEEGVTIVVSSHILNELSEFCTSIGVMEKSRLTISGSIEDIVAGLNRRRRFVVETIGSAERVALALAERDGVEEPTFSNGRCEFECAIEDGEIPGLISELLRDGAPIKGFYERRLGVEDVLMEIGASETS